MGGRWCLGRHRRRGMALLCLVDALEHPVVMEMTGGLVVPVELVVVLVVAAFDRCALLSIWEAERREGAEVEFKPRDAM
jgi:hypothetical protein